MKQKKTIVIDEKTPLLLLAGPMFLELLLNTMLHNVDTIMLSHYDEYAVGAVGNANSIMFYWYKKKWLGKSVVDGSSGRGNKDIAE